MILIQVSSKQHLLLSILDEKPQLSPNVLRPPPETTGNMGGRFKSQTRPHIPLRAARVGPANPVTGRRSVSNRRGRQCVCRARFEVVSSVCRQPVRGPSIDPQQGTQPCTACTRSARLRRTCASHSAHRLHPPKKTATPRRRGPD